VTKAFVVAMLLALSWLVNHVVDGLGHSMKNGIPVRRPRTHSIFTAPLWGGLCAAPFYFLTTQFPLLPATTVGFGQLQVSSAVWLFAAGVYVAYNHLFLDSLTEAGIFYTTHRIALAHIRYNNSIVNTLFVVLGLLLLYVALAAPSL
jgi:hypothetical protein